MSVLLIGLEEDLGVPVIERLLQEGDIVGVIEEDEGRATRWREMGAHVAGGAATDFDLVERAAQHARSIVVADSRFDNSLEVAEAVLTGARLVPGDRARIVFIATRPDTGVGEALSTSEFDFIILRVGGSRFWNRARNRLRPELIAEAVNAADDLAGAPRLDLDLSDSGSWTILGLPAPS